jgi:hypothetical protein
VGDNRNINRVLVGRLEGKRSLGRPGHGWDDNFEVKLKERE